MSGERDELAKIRRRLEYAGVDRELIRDVMDRLHLGDTWMVKANSRQAYIDLITPLVPPDKLPRPYAPTGHRYTGD